MLTRYIHFCCVVIVYLFGQFIYSKFTMLEDNDMTKLSVAYNGEAYLALGRKIPLCRAETSDLQLISGISDDLAKNILRERIAICNRGVKLPTSKEYQALELVRGIGKITAKKFGKFITTRCPDKNQPTSSKK